MFGEAVDIFRGAKPPLVLMVDCPNIRQKKNVVFKVYKNVCVSPLTIKTNYQFY